MRGFLFPKTFFCFCPPATHDRSMFCPSDHNYLMMKPLVSSCHCSHDLRVNNLAQGAQTVVHQKSRCFPSEEDLYLHLVVHTPLNTLSDNPFISLSMPSFIRHQWVLLIPTWKWSFSDGSLSWRSLRENPIHGMKVQSPERWDIYRWLLSLLNSSVLSYKYAAQYSATGFWFLNEYTHCKSLSCFAFVQSDEKKGNIKLFDQL